MPSAGCFIKAALTFATQLFAESVHMLPAGHKLTCWMLSYSTIGLVISESIRFKEEMAPPTAGSLTSVSSGLNWGQLSDPWPGRASQVKHLVGTADDVKKKNPLLNFFVHLSQCGGYLLSCCCSTKCIKSEETCARSPHSTSSASICQRGFFTLSLPHFGLIIVSGCLCGPLWNRGTGCPFGASKILGGL